MSVGSRGDVGRFTAPCTSIQFLCLIFLVSCPIFVDKCKLDGKKISKKAASEKFGKEEMDRMIREAKKAFAEDSLQEISWWMGEGMLSITFR